LGLPELNPASKILDHLLLGARDLNDGIGWIAKKTGIKPVIGGIHPGGGTRNALISLGGQQYLEVIAPDPGQSSFNFDIDLRKLDEPHLITWAADTSDIDALAENLRGSGMEVIGPRAGSRTRPDNKVLSWKTLGIRNDLGYHQVEPVPFFIQWTSSSLHPSQDSPKGCELQSITFEHPNPGQLDAAFHKLGIEARVTKGNSARLVAEIKTPIGLLKL
jgi:hypothetical protein